MRSSLSILLLILANFLTSQNKADTLGEGSFKLIFEKGYQIKSKRLQNQEKKERRQMRVSSTKRTETYYRGRKIIVTTEYLD